MIDVIFSFGTETIQVRVEDKMVLFRTQQFGTLFSPLEGLKLDKSGVIKEFPDLKEDEKWREKAIERFNKHIKSIPYETLRMNYVIDELTKYGYIPMYKQRAGFRIQKL